MALLPIVLGVRRVSGRQRGEGNSFPPASDAKTRAAVLKRDGNSCQYCGFTSLKHQTVRWKNGGGKLNTESFVTACLFCDQCFSLESAGFAGSGILVWLPEMSQAQINDVCRAAYVARATGEEYVETAQTALDAIMVRRYEARRRLGTDDPLVLATVLSDGLSNEEYDQRVKKLDGLRLMPLDRRIVRRANRDVDVFPEMLAYWQSDKGPFRGVQPAAWEKIFSKVSAGAGQA